VAESRLSGLAAGSAAERRVEGQVFRRPEAFGYTVTSETFALPRGGSSRNVVGTSAGVPRVVVLADADGVRGTSAANHKASSVAVLLELARALRGRLGVVVAALGSEERIETRSRYYLGSAAFVRSLSGSERRASRFAVSLTWSVSGPLFASVGSKRDATAPHVC
jgi:Peptidase family M28